MHFKNTKWNRYHFGWLLVCLVSGFWTLSFQPPAQADTPRQMTGTENQTNQPQTNQPQTNQPQANQPQANQPQAKIEWLFVQNAEGVTFNNGKLTLKKVSPETVMFADRPERIAGHVTTKAFLPLWNEGKDSFTHDPPNATLSVFNEKGEPQDIVVEISNPQLNGDELTYDARVLKGKEIAQGGPCSLFIDIIGMPLTPRSFQGVERRAWRRGFR